MKNDMSLIIDILILAISVVIVLISRKRGFFKTLVSVASIIAAFVLAVTFAPRISGYFYDNVILDKLSDSISTTVSSISAKDDSGEVYDVKKLEGNSEFEDLVERFGGDVEKINEYIENVKENTSVAVEKVCRNVSAPLAMNISNALGFIIVFIVSFILIKVAVGLLSLIFKLPVLRDVDRSLGTIFGIICALLFILCVSVFASEISGLLNAVSPNMFDSAVVENSLIIRLVSHLKLQDLIFKNKIINI